MRVGLGAWSQRWLGFCAGLQLSGAYVLAGNCGSIWDSLILVGMTSRLRARTVTANRLQFGVLEAGSGPLALCLHGFPDSARTWRYLLPALADAGFHAVAPFMRGYAPTEIPEDGCFGLGRSWRTRSACTTCWAATIGPS